MRVIVDRGEVRGKKEAVVRKVPPFEDTVAGETSTVTDAVMVQYPNTSLDGGNFFGDMQEKVPLEDVLKQA